MGIQEGGLDREKRGWRMQKGSRKKVKSPNSRDFGVEPSEQKVPHSWPLAYPGLWQGAWADRHSSYVSREGDGQPSRMSKWIRKTNRSSSLRSESLAGRRNVLFAHICQQSCSGAISDCLQKMFIVML